LGVEDAGTVVRVAVGESVAGMEVGLTRGVGVVMADAGDAAPSASVNTSAITPGTLRTRMDVILNGV
jgi:hypothetical protein